MLHDIVFIRPGMRVAVVGSDEVVVLYRVSDDGELVPVKAQLATPLQELDPPLSTRLFNVLYREGHRTFEDVIATIEDPERGWKTIHNYRNLGYKAGTELNARYWDWKHPR